MQGFPVLPRYELNARLPERGTDLILKYERRPNQRPVSTLRPYLSIRAYTKSPRLFPTGVRMPRAFSRYPLRRYLTRQPLLLWQPDGYGQPDGYALGAS